MIEICGKPKEHEIEDASDTRLKSYVLQFPESDTLPILEQQKNLYNEQAMVFIKALLSFDPKKRLTAETAFLDPFILQSPPVNVLHNSFVDSFEPLNDSQWTDHLRREILTYL